MSHITLRVLCEGPTERNFVTRVLQPHLAQIHVYVKPESLLPGQYGIVGWEKVRNAIKADVGRSRSHEFVTTMIDLYKIGKYPGVEKLPGESPYDRAKRIEDKLRQELPNERFIPYVQVHEFEALVLVDCSLLPSQFPDGEAKGAPAKLTASIGDMLPELVNDDEQTAPSKRIIRFIPAYKHLKATAGPAIAGAIGLARLRAACPHFHEWITKLEMLSDEREPSTEP
jgi:hypothetical protein